jgi:hypothetical protein
VSSAIKVCEKHKRDKDIPVRLVVKVTRDRLPGNRPISPAFWVSVMDGIAHH